ncbi:ATP synthase F0 subunit B' [Brevundimonas kwangchunensis]|uniref:ATP synthase subunit b n=1 Tax=Brevundimonas kwangchunensis TaxID=322163 RepID=A0ABN1GT67_9CAUL
MAPTPPIDPHGADAHATTAADGHGGGGGLPQFETQHWFGQIAYLLVLFAILYLLISKVFAPRLRRVMDERADTISNAVSTARQVQAEAASQAEAAKAEVAAARSSARATATAAAQRIADEAATRKAADEAAVSARIAEAEAAIGKTRDAAMANVGAIAGDATAAIVERLTGKAPSAAEVAAVVKGAA